MGRVTVSHLLVWNVTKCTVQMLYSNHKTILCCKKSAKRAKNYVKQKIKVLIFSKASGEMLATNCPKLVSRDSLSRHWDAILTLNINMDFEQLFWVFCLPHTMTNLSPILQLFCLCPSGLRQRWHTPAGAPFHWRQPTSRWVKPATWC